jgi:hypothetical protein
MKLCTVQVPDVILNHIPVRPVLAQRRGRIRVDLERDGMAESGELQTA